jgi:D-amino-acid dehydrogenase
MSELVMARVQAHVSIRYASKRIMKIIIVGSGLIGVTTAFFLKGEGHDVTVVDRREGPGEETSFANGSLLTPSMSEPWNAPGCWRVLLASLARADSPLKLRLRALPGLSHWGVTFLRNSAAARFEHNTRENMRLALYSLDVMHSLRQETQIEYGRTVCGTLRLFRDPASLEHAATAARKLVLSGVIVRRLSKTEALEVEPALMPIEEKLAGALHYPGDESGDAHVFCVSLAEYARRAGVEFRFRTNVAALEVRSGQVTGVLTDAGRLVADRYVVAAGSYSAPLMRRARIDLPVRPAKGYSVTFADDRERPSLGIPFVDDALHAVVVPLKGAIRVAGTAEFAGFDLTLPRARIQNLVSLARTVLPRAELDERTAKPWCGLRPMSADGVPIIGATKMPNLFVNTGHGHLGWTMAVGSGKLLADLICGNAPAVDPVPFALARFNAA